MHPCRRGWQYLAGNGKLAYMYDTRPTGLEVSLAKSSGIAAAVHAGYLRVAHAL